MDKEAIERVAIRLHTQERTLVKVVYERSLINCGWDELPQSFKNLYLQAAVSFISGLETLGYRKLPKDKPPLLSEADLYDKYDHPPESEIDICDDCPIATMAMEAQREVDIKHYEGK